MLYELKLHSDFLQGLKQVHQSGMKFKNSLMPSGYEGIVSIVVAFPPIFSVIAVWILVDKATAVFSNVPGPKTPYIYNGKQTNKVIAMIPGLSDLAFGVSAVSHSDKLTMTLQADNAFIANTKELAVLLEANYKKYIAKVDVSKWEN